MSFPAHNGDVIAFGRDVNIGWKHGIKAEQGDANGNTGRLSIIAWGTPTRRSVFSEFSVCLQCLSSYFCPQFMDFVFRFQGLQMRRKLRFFSCSFLNRHIDLLVLSTSKRSSRFKIIWRGFKRLTRSKQSTIFHCKKMGAGRPFQKNLKFALSWNC